MIMCLAHALACGCSIQLWHRARRERNAGSASSTAQRMLHFIPFARTLVQQYNVPAWSMSNDTEKRDLRRVLIFGIVAATLEMGVVLWLLYC